MKKLFALVATASLMFSCSQEVTPDLEKLPINISVGQQTRANDSTYESGDEVGIYVVNYVGSTAGSLSATGNQVDNMHFTYSNNAWAPDETIYWKDKTTAADFYAYYPYSESPNISAHPFAVATDQSADGDFWDSDFLWGKTANVSPTSSAVPIVTNHSLSRILVDVVPGEGFAGAWGNAAVSVKICDVKTSATIDLATGVATATGEKGEIAPLAAAETGTTLSYKAMMIPQVVADNSKLVVVTVDGVDYIYRKGYEFKANTEHKFTVTVNKTGGSVDMSIGEWTIDDTTNEGDAMDESVSSENTIPNNEIWYTATAKVEPALSADFGATVVSNEWDEATGKGVISFDGDVTSIGVWAFTDCKTLTSITIPNKINEVAARAFDGCDALTSFYGKFASNDNRCLIIDGVLCCFAAAGITEYAIPSGVISIGSAFEGCTSLTNITIPDSVTTIGANAFQGCEYLTSITIPDSVTSIGMLAFSGITLLEHVTIGSGITSIENGTFSYCRHLTSVTIPDNVISIGDSAFSYCTALESIIIGSGVTSMGENTFKGCEKLSKIYCKPITPPSIRNNTIYISPGFIGVPRDSVSLYKSASWWKNYDGKIGGYDFV